MLSPKQQKQPLPFLLYVSLLYDFHVVLLKKSGYSHPSLHPCAGSRARVSRRRTACATSGASRYSIPSTSSPGQIYWTVLLGACLASPCSVSVQYSHRVITPRGPKHIRLFLCPGLKNHIFLYINMKTDTPPLPSCIVKRFALRTEEYALAL